MDILDLDEAQGLDAVTIRERAIEHLNWELRWELHQGKWILASMSDGAGGTAQSMLRQINPRMRKGCPSEAARRAHDGFWLMRQPYSPPAAVRWVGPASVGEWQMQQSLPMCPNHPNYSISQSESAHCFFWPCDAEGNKVRWPEKNGVLL